MMSDQFPKLDRAKLREQVFAELERMVEEVADAVDDAPAGRVIRDSEEKARDALDRFRQVVYEDSPARQNQCGGSRFSPLRLARRRDGANVIRDGRRTAC
jgi:hypothetical protein